MKDKVLFNPQRSEIADLRHGIGVIGSFFIGFVLGKIQ